MSGPHGHASRLRTGESRRAHPERLSPLRGAPSGAVTAATAIAAALRDDIVGMALLPGAPLRDTTLCERFGMSRTPVREALIRLSEEGLIDIRPQFGTFVSRIPVHAIAEALVIREALEGVTVEGAAKRAAPLVGLDAALDEQCLRATQRDVEGFHAADEAFHEAIAERAQHPGIWRLVRQVKVQIDRARRLTLPAPGRMDQVIAEHLVIRDAIAKGAPEAARAAMTAHLRIVIPDVLRLKQQHPDFFAEA